MSRSPDINGKAKVKVVSMKSHEDMVEEEYSRFRRSADWELNNIVKALNLMPLLNTPQQEARLEAVKRIKKERKVRR